MLFQLHLSSLLQANLQFCKSQLILTNSHTFPLISNFKSSQSLAIQDILFNSYTLLLQKHCFCLLKNLFHPFFFPRELLCGQQCILWLYYCIAVCVCARTRVSVHVCAGTSLLTNCLRLQLAERQGASSVSSFFPLRLHSPQSLLTSLSLCTNRPVYFPFCPTLQSFLCHLISSSDYSPTSFITISPPHHLSIPSSLRTNLLPHPIQ